jgi:hypothetical protein
MALQKQRRSMVVMAYRSQGGRQRWGRGQNEREGPSFIVVRHAERCGPIEGGDGSVQQQSGRVGMCLCSAEAQ